MKFSKKILAAFLSIMIFSSTAFAALPSITLLTAGNSSLCSQMLKVVKGIEKEYKGKISASYVDLDKNQEIAKKYNVRHVPTLIFKNSAGKEIAQEVGYKSPEDVLNIFYKSGIVF